jgi:Histidine kinase-like ATPase domain
MKRSRRFEETTLSIPNARQFVATSLTAVTAVVPEVCETATLLVSELATNAIVHAASAFEVTVVYPTPAGRVRVEVADGNPHQPTPLDPPPTAPHGRGLLLVATLSDEWGVQVARSGKSIWFELAPSAAWTGQEAPATRRQGIRSLRQRRSFFFGARFVGNDA